MGRMWRVCLLEVISCQASPVNWTCWRWGVVWEDDAPGSNISKLPGPASHWQKVSEKRIYHGSYDANLWSISSYRYSFFDTFPENEDDEYEEKSAAVILTDIIPWRSVLSLLPILRHHPLLVVESVVLHSVLLLSDPVIVFVLRSFLL